MNTDLINTIVARWNDPNRRPLFKGNLIDKDDCMCAQGDILHNECGWSFEKLKSVEQKEADSEIAKALGISVAHAVLLRQINDKADGAPGIVITNPELFLGDQSFRILKFWHHIDRMTKEDWSAWISAWTAAWRSGEISAWTAAKDSARSAAGSAAGIAAGIAAWTAAKDSARSAAGIAAWTAAKDSARSEAESVAESAEGATNEIQGASKLDKFFFLPFFGFFNPADLDALS
jgi:hypothetical protein